MPSASALMAATTASVNLDMSATGSSAIRQTLTVRQHFLCHGRKGKVQLCPYYQLLFDREI